MNNDEVIKRIEKAKKNKDKLPKVKSKVKVYVDPPYGHKYGFPKALPDLMVEDMRAWLIECGYPEKDADFALKHCRMWEEE